MRAGRRGIVERLDFMRRQIDGTGFRRSLGRQLRANRAELVPVAIGKSGREAHSTHEPS